MASSVRLLKTVVPNSASRPARWVATLATSAPVTTASVYGMATDRGLDVAQVVDLKDTEEADRIGLLGALGRRLGRAHLIPGMTIHQAKGREWANVGVYLQPDEEHHLAAGLSRERPSDRALYVGLTRAKRSVYRV